MTIRQTFDVPPRTATPAGELASVVGTPADGDVPTWNDALQQWEPQAASGGLPPATPDGALLGVIGGAWVAVRITSDSNGDVVTDSNGDVVFSPA